MKAQPSHWDIDRAIDRSPCGLAPVAIWYVTRGGVYRLYAFRPNREWASNLTRLLNLNGYPKRLYYWTSTEPMRPAPCLPKNISNGPQSSSPSATS